MVHLIELIKDKHRSDSKEIVPRCKDTEADKLAMWEVGVFKGDKFVETKDVDDQKELVDNYSDVRTDTDDLFEKLKTDKIKENSTHADPGVGEELF